MPRATACRRDRCTVQIDRTSRVPDVPHGAIAAGIAVLAVSAPAYSLTR